MLERALADHALSNLFPLLEGAAFEARVADIRGRGCAGATATATALYPPP